jgi:purine nucleoside permease
MVFHLNTPSASIFWHGKLLDQWANNRVRYQTGNRGNFVTSAMEDTGILQSLTFLAQARRVDLNRVLVLRTASNYDQQRMGISAAQSLAEMKTMHYDAYPPAIEAADRVGNVVVSKIVANWGQCRDNIP